LIIANGLTKTKFMQDEYRPIIDPIFDFKTSCTKDDAVQYLMGWLQGPLRFDPIPKGASAEDVELCDYSWETLLTNNREWAETAYSNAKMEKRLLEREVTDDALAKLDAEISEKLAELEKCDLAIIEAHKYRCCVDYELAKGSDSMLMTDPSVTENVQPPNIMIGSLRQWALETFEIDILKPSKNVINLRQQFEGSKRELLSRTKDFSTRE